MLRLLFLILSFLGIAKAECPLQDGDLLFIKSQTSQAKLLKLTTGSEWSHVGMAFKREKGWDVIESIQPTRWTTLYSFLRRSKNLSFQVMRPNFEFDAKSVRQEAEKHIGADYDLIFGWDDKRWYCSELVWKAYKNVSKVHIGELEKVGDLNVNHPLVMSEAKKRFQGYGMKFDAETWKNYDVITPVQMMKSTHVEKIMDDSRIEEMKDCVL